MAEGFSIDIDTSAVIAALTRLGDAAQPYVNEASHQTADAIVREAQARLQRKLGPKATGESVEGIQDRPAFDGNGFIVLSGNARMPNLPLWLEKGTKKGKPGSHTSPGLDYFYASCQLEEGAHFRRLQGAVTEAIAATGLGE